MTRDVIDLFAGPGGWDVAARDLGLTVHGIEWDASACATRRAAGLDTTHGDVRAYGPHTHPASALIASPPCPTFSTAGSGSGRRALASVIEAAGHLANGGGLLAHAIDDPDERTGLVLEPLRWALEANAAGAPYEWIALEQVPAVLPVWEAYAQTLQPLGYSVATGVLSAERYGVPQTRRRAILIASRVRPVAMPAATHSRYYPRDPARLDPGVLQWVSMADALGWGMTGRPSMTVTGGGSATGGAEPFGNAARQGMRREAESGRWAMHTSGASNRTCPPRRADEPSRTILGGGQAAWIQERPATTVQGDPRLGAPGRREFVKGGQSMFSGESVRVTVQEAAILQSFPADYPWDALLPADHVRIKSGIIGDHPISDEEIRRILERGVRFTVLGCGENDQVLDAIIQLVSVDVVNDLARLRPGDQAMLRDAIATPGHDVSTSAHQRSTPALVCVERITRESPLLPVAGAEPTSHRVAFTVTARLLGWVGEILDGSAIAETLVVHDAHSPRGMLPDASFDITSSHVSILAERKRRGTSKTAQYQQVGNAVPPLLARHVLAAAAGITESKVAA